MGEIRIDANTRTVIERGLSRRAALRWTGGAAAAVAGAGVVTRGLAAQQATPVAPDTGDTIILGALLSLTGDWSDLGIASQAVLEIAVSGINEELALVGSPFQVQLRVKDTSLEPEQAIEMTRELADEGASYIIGPQASAEVDAVKDVADEAGMIVVSHGSTASSLASPDDNVFRVIPTDVPETEALIALMQRDGIEVVVPIWREDTGNIGLHDAMARMFPEQGGVMHDGVAHSPGTGNFSEIVAALADQVERAVADNDASTVAIHLATFDDATEILREASGYPVLASVRWYGTDGVARLEALAADADAAAFAVETGFTCALVGMPNGTRDAWEPIGEQVEAATGQTADAFAFAAYDAAWVTTLASIEAGGTQDQSRLEAAFVRTADRYFGLTLTMTLDENGDREQGNFDFWVIVEVDGAYEWQRDAQYSTVFEQITEPEEG